MKNPQEEPKQETLEVWKDIPDFEGYYQVSNLGNVRNYKTKNIIKPETSNTGYLTVRLNKNTIRSIFTIHRLVAKQFVENKNPKSYTLVMHLDDCKKNNIASNLEWGTYKSNSHEAWRKGLCEKLRLTGKNNGAINGKKSSIPIVQLDENLFLVNEFQSIRDAEKATGIKNTTINSCCKRRIKTAGGFIWKYKFDYDLVKDYWYKKFWEDYESQFKKQNNEQ
jgi:hypothetical protein